MPQTLAPASHGGAVVLLAPKPGEGVVGAGLGGFVLAVHLRDDAVDRAHVPICQERPRLGASGRGPRYWRRREVEPPAEPTGHAAGPVDILGGRRQPFEGREEEDLRRAHVAARHLRRDLRQRGGGATAATAATAVATDAAGPPQLDDGLGRVGC
eukprot:SAG22_NODE_765_length_7393_cov_5.670003_2_plen_155_part_00